MSDKGAQSCQHPIVTSSNRTCSAMARKRIKGGPLNVYGIHVEFVCGGHVKSILWRHPRAQLEDL